MEPHVGQSRVVSVPAPQRTVSRKRTYKSSLQMLVDDVQAGVVSYLTVREKSACCWRTFQEIRIRHFESSTKYRSLSVQGYIKNFPEAEDRSRLMTAHG